MHKTVVIGSVTIDLYRLVDKMKNENITEKGICCLDGQENNRTE